MNAWANLPNAAHIDRVLAHVRAHPEKWHAAWDAARGTAKSAAWVTAWDAAWNTARDTARDVARRAAWNAAGDAVWAAAKSAAWNAAGGATMALIAYDDCGYLLSQPPELLRAQYALTNDPAVLLLLPTTLALDLSEDLRNNRSSSSNE